MAAKRSNRTETLSHGGRQEKTKDTTVIERAQPHTHGGEVLRGLSDVPHSTLYEGRFGRMFRNLPAFEPEEQHLLNLAEVMIESSGNESGDNPDIPAGYTYLGQFIDHDITFDPVSKLMRQNDPNALNNFRTPRYDLDSVYGGGPATMPYLYDDGIRLLIGKTSFNNPVTGEPEDDVPRTRAVGRPNDRRAIIGDPRNDENIIISQIHLGILKYHNAVVQAMIDDGTPADAPDLFDDARNTVRWHYQWMVIHDFLARIVGEDVINDILKYDSYKVHTSLSPVGQPVRAKVDLKFYGYRNKPFMPVEYSVAAYRFGHSMVRARYDLNNIVRQVPIFEVSHQTVIDNPLADLSGNRERPEIWMIDWQRYFEFPGGDTSEMQLSRKIDSKLSSGLATLPVPGLQSLPARNLSRGKALGLPSGQAVARAMGIPSELILMDSALGLPPEQTAVFGRNTPLWAYILKEAEILSDGLKLGPVGGRIVAEVMIGLLKGDPFSFLSVDPAWGPTANRFGADADGNFEMAHLLDFAGSRIVAPIPSFGGPGGGGGGGRRRGGGQPPQG